ncbi:hypothetical protein H310_08075 [Aphanomyces invadans]|uniref:Myb-like domain-containing protein n=1 Tax=Aphanomyces invadans TaxID=157072 RepID=A0A024U0F7_9STRA|nr:hypothetical protein H310_08075 [Aphanomyces invadans]ETV99361.1 hypothetical protein H310_08075 [Aphanomyces invadans]RHY24801.1 hypothetical protein DYB32_008684 [Aphanomyces invadans]|eukprot:XP_008871917.1 hypothetical protein H310_08075 [Aphanomyces invadans]
MAEAAEDSTETLDKKWWSEDDDILLLTQINNDRPFLQRQATKAWEAMALTLRGIDEFNQQGIDGKKAQNRFLLLMRQHKTRKETAARLSGAAEEETAKSRLLDDLASLFNDAIVKRKKAAAVVDAAEKAEKVKFVREQAMQRGRRQSFSDSSDVAEPTVTSKRKMIMDAHEMEVALELEKLEFKRLKFERELEERAKGREEREK